MRRDVQNLQQFYELMLMTKKVREKIVASYFHHQGLSPEWIDDLKVALKTLEDIPKADGKHILPLKGERSILLDLTYEIEELRKDIYFIQHSLEEFYQYLDRLHDDFSRQIKAGEEFLKGLHFKNFTADRDGTVNNYCGRYRSSIQSIYNAIFLTLFARKCADHSVILTSAPLGNGGLIEISITPPHTFIYAGSKGREYIDSQGERKQLTIGDEEQKILDILNKRLVALVSQPAYEIFSLIGSGLQFKFGQTTISRQDIYHSISEEESEHFFNLVKGQVQDVDPEKKFLGIEDTGLDIEIILKLKNNDSSRAFDKGDGINFLNRELSLDMERGPNLVCGDTRSDVPMAAASMEKTENTWCLFVTEDEGLQAEVKGVCPRAFFVSGPDVLVALLHKVSHEGVTIRQAARE
jgi:hypothetical protein